MIPIKTQGMKMKSPVAVVLISLAFLFAIFHSCQGLRCFACQSRNYAIKECETISGDWYLHDYGDGAHYCMKALMNKTENGKEERLLARNGFSEERRKHVDDMVKEHRDKGFDVDVLTCKKDKCNGK